MHREDRPKRRAAVHANAQFIYKDLKESINMHWGERCERRFDIGNGVVLIHMRP
jgi:hypothetical protein